MEDAASLEREATGASGHPCGRSGSQRETRVVAVVADSRAARRAEPDLRAVARQVGGRRLDVAAVLLIGTGIVASVGTHPQTSRGQLKLLSTLEPTSPAIVWTAVSAGILVLLVVVGFGPTLVRSIPWRGSAPAENR